jgi:anti-sigma factor RsiW
LAIDINISNYESYLLSAADGELNDAEKAALEQFLHQHPHLRQELAALEALRFTPDPEVSFGSKAALYRSAAGITAQHYHTALLDYVDNELSAADKTTLEQLILQHPHIRQELAQLQAARLTPDLTLQYPDKSSLYKHNRRTITPVWWWGAAAAVVAGFMIWMLPVAFKQQHTAPQLAHQASDAANSPQAPGALAHQQSSAANTATPAPGQPQNDTMLSTGIAHAAPAQQPEQVVAGRSIAHHATRAEEEHAAKNKPVPAEEDPSAMYDRNKANALAALNNVPQPANTTGEIVKQSQQEVQQDVASADVADKNTVMAKTTEEKISNMAIPAARPAAVAAPAVKGELVVSVSVNGEGKLLNGVANVARFFAKKKKSN